MRYKDYNGYTKTYVIVHVTGNGVIEDPFIDHSVVFETNNKNEANSKVKKLTLENNSIAEIESSWYNNRYHININTLSKNGANLYKQFNKEFDSLWGKALSKL